MNSKSFLHCQLLLFIIFFFFFISSSSAVPASRVGKFVQETGHPVAVDDFSSQITLEEAALEDVIKGRLDLESNDYPGSGANNRHTPRQPGWN